MAERIVPITIHAVAEDGLPDMEKLVGRVAFIFDGCVVSGWPLDPVEEGDVYERLGWNVEAEGVLWEANSDVGHGRPFGNVAHWIEFREGQIR